MSARMANFGHSGVGKLTLQDLWPARRLVKHLLEGGREERLLRYFSTDFRHDSLNEAIRKVRVN
jgi:hypothetical protein